MSRPNNTKDYLRDIESFLHASEERPPRILFERISHSVYRDLAPSRATVFSKAFLIHVCAGFFSVAFICPQFGVNPLGNSGIFHLLMHLNQIYCTATCGAIFLGISTFFAGTVLSNSEAAVLTQHKFAYFSGVTIVSLLFFSIIGNVNADSIVLFWMFGAMIAAIFCLELGRAFRASLRSQ